MPQIRFAFPRRSGTWVAQSGRRRGLNVVETGAGLRLRFALGDWERIGLRSGQRVPARLSGRDDVWLFVTHVTALPPVVWVMLAKRVRVAGCSRAASTCACSRGLTRRGRGVAAPFLGLLTSGLASLAAISSAG